MTIMHWCYWAKPIKLKNIKIIFYKDHIYLNLCWTTKIYEKWNFEKVKEYHIFLSLQSAMISMIEYMMSIMILLVWKLNSGIKYCDQCLII